MTAPKKRIVGKPTPNEHPRTPDPVEVLANLMRIEQLADVVIPDLRGLGLHNLADSLRVEAEHVRTIRVSAQFRSLKAVTS